MSDGATLVATLAAAFIAIVIGVTITSLNWHGIEQQIISDCLAAGKVWAYVPNTSATFECVLPV